MKNSITFRVIRKKVKCFGIKFVLQDENDREIGRTFLYLMTNDLHKKPFCFLEDLYIVSNLRGKGLGTRLLKMVIEEAQKEGCYKLIANSRYQRPEVHRFYKELGFKDHGKEFRLDF